MIVAPLQGLRVLVTRPIDPADRLGPRLERAGAAVAAVPTIRLTPPADPIPLKRAGSGLAAYDWVVVTSVTAVERLAEAATVSGRADALAACRMAAVGPATADAVRRLCGPDCLVPPVYRGEALADGIVEATDPGCRNGARALIVQAEASRPVLRERLVAAGMEVDVAPAYAVEVNWPVREALLEFIELGLGDWLTFTASSAVRAFVELVGPQTGGAAIAAISPVTAATVRDLGLPVHAVAVDHSMAGLVEALSDAVGRSAGPRREVAR